MYERFAKTADSLSYVSRPSRLELAEHTKDYLVIPKSPIAKAEHGLFLSVCTVFRRFVLSLASIAASINKKRRRQQCRISDLLYEKESAPAASLQEKLICPLVLALPRSKRLYTVDTDARHNKTMCLRFLENGDGSNSPVCYRSHTLNDKKWK